MQVSLSVPSLTQILNSVVADSSSNGIPDARYQGGSVGFQCVSGQACSFSSWQLIVQATPGISIGKLVDKQTVPTETHFNYTLTYGAVGNDLNGVRIIDVLPFSGDGRTPATALTGALGLAGPVTLPAASSGTVPTSADPDMLVYYTQNVSADINTDPYDTGHDFTGSGANSATGTA